MLFLKRGGMAIPAWEDDIDEFKKMKQGQLFDCKTKRVSDRSLRHLRLYWGGLIQLTLQYWEPDHGTITPGEQACVDNVIAYIERLGKSPGSLQIAKAEALEEINKIRRFKYEIPAKQKQHLHDWILEQLNMYELYQTPEGVRKKLQSISFINMTQSAFDEYYSLAFGICWRQVMQRISDSEEQFQEQVILQMSSMG